MILNQDYQLIMMMHNNIKPKFFFKYFNKNNLLKYFFRLAGFEPATL